MTSLNSPCLSPEFSHLVILITIVTSQIFLTGSSSYSPFPQEKGRQVNPEDTFTLISSRDFKMIKLCLWLSGKNSGGFKCTNISDICAIFHITVKNFISLFHISYVTLVINMRPLPHHSAVAGNLSNVPYDIWWELGKEDFIPCFCAKACRWELKGDIEKEVIETNVSFSHLSFSHW